MSRVQRQVARFGTALGLLVALVLVPTGSEAASWAFKDTYSVAPGYCGTAVYARAGYVNFHRGGGSVCYYNSTLTNVDDDLRNDTTAGGTAVESWDNQFINIANNSVTNWIGADCTGTKVTVTASFSTALSYRSYKRNSSAGGC